MLHNPPILFALWTHPAMLAWLAAASAPLIIHLLNRRQHREVVWAAMQYLLAAMKKNSRRILIEQWILLAVRTSLIALVVLAVAEPVLEQAGIVAGVGQPTHKVLVIDGSYSMAYKPTDKSRFERAKQLAEEIVEGSHQGDGFTLVLMADPPQVVVGAPSFGARDFVDEIANLKLPHGGGDLPATVAKVEQVLQTARREHPRLVREEVYFLTDLGRTSWAPDLHGDAVAEFRERSRRLGEATALTVLDLGQTGAENLAVTRAAASEPLATTARDVSLEAEIRNFGRQPRAHQLVEFFVDGRRAGEQFVDLAPGASKTISFPYRFDMPGDHAVEVRLATDLLDVDNHRWLALPVKDHIRVLCVDGRPAGAAFKGAADYLAVALAPQSDPTRPALVQTQVVPEGALMDTDLSKFDCVFLCNVAQFTASEAQVLRAYLNAGGGLVFFLGEHVLADSYNRQLARPSNEQARVLPALLAGKVAKEQYGLNPLGYAHPLVAAFRNQEQSGLLTTPVHEYFKLTIPEASRAKVALALENGDPLVVEEPIGRGRSIVVATSADVSWTAMPLWPSYVPLVQELLLFAMHDGVQDRNVLVGQPLSGVLKRTGPRAVHVKLPTGETSQARIATQGSESAWSFSETYTSGLYSAEGGALVGNGAAGKSVAGGSVAASGGDGNGAAGDASAGAMFAVNLNTAESELSQIDTAELAADVWPGVQFYHHTNWRDLGDEPATEIVGHSYLHRWLLVAVFGLLVTETFLAWFFGRRNA
jgi:Aerotolerance regulator N-terminal/von Willebrand factor type A domain